MKHNKYILGFAAFFAVTAAITVIGVTQARYHFISDITAPKSKSHLKLYLSGSQFPAETEYTLTLENGDQIDVKSSVDGDIKSSYILPAEIGANKILDFFFAKKDTTNLKSPTLNISINTETYNVTWNGRFFTPSDNVSLLISNADTSLKNNTKSDWSGHFQQNVSYNGVDLMKESACIKTETTGQQLCLSFGVHRAPEIIQVLIPGTGVPGGGSDDGFTIFDRWEEPSDCTPSDRNVELSLCQSSHVLSLQEDLSNSWYDFTRMTLQLSAGMMQQVGFIGSLFDAKNQLETQLLFWKKQEEAHDDYHPSEQLCSIASMAQDLAATEARREFNTYAVTRALSFEDQNPVNTSTAEGSQRNVQFRIQRFRETYCTPSNLNNVLRFFCDGLEDGQFARLNRDINYTKLINVPKTLDVDFSDNVSGTTTTIVAGIPVTTDVLGPTADEEDVLAMGNLLFGHNAMDFPNTDTSTPAAQTKFRAMINDPDKFVHSYQEHRSISAIRNVARHSYANIVGMKAESSGFSNTYIEALMEQFGMPADDIDRFIGENPSYFAQMHVLTKQIYQHPNFYTNLITKEANVGRFEVSMEATTLMANRDRYEAILRKELLLSLLIEMKLRELQIDVDTGLETLDSRN